MTRQGEVCCSSPAAMCYWFAVSLVAWGMLSLIGIYWRPLRASAAATLFFAMAIGCVANWLKNRTLHCGITGPLFLIAGIVYLLSDMHLLDVGSRLVLPVVVIVTGIAFLLESRYSERSA